MTQAIPSILRTSTLLLASGAVVALATAGREFALGMLLTGLLTFASLGLTVWGTRGMVSPNPGFRPSSLVLGLKLPLVCLAVWVLVGRFPPLSVALGGLALVLGATFYAASSLLVPGQVRRV